MRSLHTIETTNARKVYTTNGVTTAFPTTFQFNEAEDLVVTYVDTAGAETTKTLTTHYTVSGGGTPAATGTVTMLVAPATGSLVIQRVSSQLQDLDLITQGATPADGLEAQLDRTTMIVQENADVADRSITLNKATVTPVGELVAPTLMANKVLAFDADGNPVPSTLDIDDIESGSIDAAASAVSAAASASTATTQASNASASASAAAASAAAAAVSAATVPTPTANALKFIRVNAGATAYEVQTVAEVRTDLGLSTSDSPQFTAVNVGAATDTTITRVSAGVIAVEGATVYAQGGALGTPASATLTNATGLPQAGTVGLTTADSPQFAAVNIGAATDTTITRTGAGDIAVEGNAIYRADGTDVPVTDGGTGASTAGGALTNLGVTAAAQTILDDASVAAIATTLGLGTANSPTHASLTLTTASPHAAPQLTFVDSGLAHGMTAVVAATDIYLQIIENTSNGGGPTLQGLGTGTRALILDASNTTDNTTQSTSGEGCIQLRTYKKSGTGRGAAGANANIVTFSSNDVTKFIVTQEGAIFLDGSITATTFDDHDDDVLSEHVNALYEKGHEGISPDAKAYLEDAGMIGKAPKSETPLHNATLSARLSTGHNVWTGKRLKTALAVLDEMIPGFLARFVEKFEAEHGESEALLSFAARTAAQVDIRVLPLITPEA